MSRVRVWSTERLGEDRLASLAESTAAAIEVVTDDTVV